VHMGRKRTKKKEIKNSIIDEMIWGGWDEAKWWREETVNSLLRLKREEEEKKTVCVCVCVCVSIYKLEYEWTVNWHS
jgi:hypothetical protein